MKIGILGTGHVGNTIGARLIELGHTVMMGSRTATNEKARAFAAKHEGKGSAGTFADAAAYGEVIFNCGKGIEAIHILKSAGAKNLEGKVLIDVSNPLDFSRGFPPSLSVCNTDSMGETIQREFPNVRVVKSLNTMSCHLMVRPDQLNGGDHDVFVGGNDAGAKKVAIGILESFGWKPPHIVDLGDITSSRGAELVLPVWLRLYGAKGNGTFNLKVVG